MYIEGDRQDWDERNGWEAEGGEVYMGWIGKYVTDLGFPVVFVNGNNSGKNYLTIMVDTNKILFVCLTNKKAISKKAIRGKEEKFVRFVNPVSTERERRANIKRSMTWVRSCVHAHHREQPRKLGSVRGSVCVSAGVRACALA